MHKTYYRQHPLGAGPQFRPPTFTVAQLRESLSDMPDDAPVIYQMPSSGVFGANICQALDTVRFVELEACTRPNQGYIDDETGRFVEQEDDHLPEWKGVVIS